MMRLTAYAGVSLSLAATVILKALHQRANFYSACVYLSQSNANLMILTNLCLLIVGFLLFGLQRLLYGNLRPIETEQLYEKAWFAVTETCLAMTIFRGELGGWFVVMFVCLLVGKVWGWIGEGRVEVLEQQPPSNPRLFHTRLAISLLLAISFNSFMLEYAVKTVLRQAKPDMMVMFGFEFAVLTILSTSTTARYVLSLAEIYIVRQQKRARLAERRAEIQASREEILRTSQTTSSELPRELPNEDDIDEAELDVPGWEDKGRYIFYLDLITDFFKLVVYLSFFAILFTFYGLPIHILRDVAITLRSFVKRVVDFVRYRNATRDMNLRYPDATAEEIAREDVCIICREEMRPWQPFESVNDRSTDGRAAGRVPERLRPKKLPCGHLLHFACLRSWLERQQNCPTCRHPVTRTGSERVGHDGENPAARANPPPMGNARAPRGRPRAWVLNFGPLRVGFGAARGDPFQDIAPRLNDAQAPADQAPNANPPRENHQSAGAEFASGSSSSPESPINRESTSLNIQNQIAHLDQQINREIDSLLTISDQLQVVRLLQGELARLRAINSNRLLVENVHNAALPVPSDASRFVPQRQFISDPRSVTLVSENQPLPEGITLPPGWTLLPLQDVQSQTQFPSSPFNDLSSSSYRPSSERDPSGSQLSSNPSQVALGAVLSYPNPASPTGLARHEGLSNSGGISMEDNVRPQRQQSRKQSTSPLRELTEVTTDSLRGDTTLPNLPCTVPGSSHPESRIENEGSSKSPHDNDGNKGKSRAATVEDFEE
ncbi:E3 ubiquitin-protein ligase hrd1 [Emydomyces testavorans]|uniref:RING-type E3 ubiquitin transferase n=1 Tax=Emydomyces testavorans TaxID=2070801 RepID=A0AAF0DGV6_9EURO|nr:E3 ubiquitin-protein ligase hrd1 [Emydomyces testavorans]